MPGLSPAAEQLYLRALRELVAHGFTFCVTGTFALRRHYPELPPELVADCDLQLPSDPTPLGELVRYLQRAGWQVSLWEVPVQLPLTAAQLAGKYYLRARQADAVLDCSYENDEFGWADFAARLQWRQGLPLASAEQILYLKAQRATLADQQVIGLCRALAQK